MAIYALRDVAPVIDSSAYVHPDATVIGAVTLGPESSVWPGAVIRADYGTITVGARTSIQDGTVLHTTAQWPTIIGDECVVGHNVHMEGCTIGNRCLIGSGSVVLNRAVIGQRSVVGANALVPEDLKLEPLSMALGVPARIRPVDPVRQAEWIDFAVTEYIDNARRFRTELRRIDQGARQ